MMFDRSAEFEKIEELLNEVRIRCNRAMIPFFWIAAIQDDGKKTAYKVALDENSKKADAGKKYICNALVPGSLEVSLADDKIKDMVKVLNGFKVVPNEPLPVVSPEDFSYNNRIRQDDGYQMDEEGIYIDEPGAEGVDGIAPAGMEVPKETFIAIDFKPNGDLPAIEEDFL